MSQAMGAQGFLNNLHYLSFHHLSSTCNEQSPHKALAASYVIIIYCTTRKVEQLVLSQD